MVYVVSFFSILLLTVFVVTLQTWRTANENPVNSFVCQLSVGLFFYLLTRWCVVYKSVITVFFDALINRLFSDLQYLR